MWRLVRKGRRNFRQHWNNYCGVVVIIRWPEKNSVGIRKKVVWD